MKKIKFIAYIGLLFIFAGILIQKQDAVKAYVSVILSRLNFSSKIEERNDYYRDLDFTFVKNTDNFSPKNYQDILNIYYSVLNAGLENFTFTCNKDYVECLNDVDTLANSQDILSDINNYVHPFNSFSHIETTYDNLGNVTLSIIKTYPKENIEKINKAVDKLYVELVKDNLNNEQNIKNVHDYIINNTIYDTMRKHGETVYNSDSAYGLLFEGYAVCGGYSDTMALFLERMNIPNFKISSDKHVWNAVYINDKWLNLDLTWDDPVTMDGQNYLEHDFFLIDTPTMLSLENIEHDFNRESYPELAN